MQTEERVVARPIRPPRLEEEHPAPVREEPRPEFSVLNLLGRVVVVAVGFGLALTGWSWSCRCFWCSSAFHCSSSGWR